MSDRMHPLTFDKLMERLLADYLGNGSIFGVDKLYHAAGVNSTDLFGGKMETPIGPAAGPNTQLAQNIIAAYAAGARFFELKTVQIIDGEELPVSKPCILADDECYNVEWSTELTVQQAMAEYIKAWYALKLISKEFALGAADGFIFNMSVGYDLAGIKSPKIDAFIEGLRDAATEQAWQECHNWAKANLSRFCVIDAAYIEHIDSHICNSITISTLHGCPPEEIERIAEYLLGEKGLHTYVKCNPTLLGYDFARKTLDKLGFDYVHFDDKHFREDLQFADAVPLLQRMQQLAEEKGLQFGVKLSNTLPVDITRGELPGEEMYMSGRALYPLTVALAGKLADALGGKLAISFSGGAELYNIPSLLKTGIRPITLATALLKPGGYQRLTQMAEAAVKTLAELEFDAAAPQINLTALAALGVGATANPRYHKPPKSGIKRQLAEAPPLRDCFAAPCHNACPINQDIPAYLAALADNDPVKALMIILERNPLPFITGTICPHNCMDNCNRQYLEQSIDIRAMKLLAAEQGYPHILPELWPKTTINQKIAVIGGGPAGMAAAFFLAKAGYQVEIFDKNAAFGGTVRNIIPDFRITDNAIDKDLSLLTALGVTFHANTQITELDSLKEQGFSAVILAVGAGSPGILRLEKGEALNAIEVLRTYKQSPESLHLGAKVAIVGGGNSAMDVARAALRLDGVEEVRIIYRRDKHNMPADAEELALAESEGVIFDQLLAPVAYQEGRLTCEIMELGEADAAGRQTPVATGEKLELAVDSLIAAVGERIPVEYYRSFGIPIGENGKPNIDPATCAAAIDNLYIIGDGADGPATVVEAIADAAKAAAAISGIGFDTYEQDNNTRVADAPRGFICRSVADAHEAERCLGCQSLCALCVECCPNRANVLIETKIGRQVVHIDDLCNECGNCARFCPYQGEPYLDKFTVFTDLKSYAASKNPGILLNEAYAEHLRAEPKDKEIAEAIADAVKFRYPYLW